MKKPLHLTVKKRWFDMIASGEKKEEYREITNHWCSRILDKEGFDGVVFRNGYGLKVPQLEVELKSIAITTGKPEWGAEIDKNYFVIRLGKVLTKTNINQ